MSIEDNPERPMASREQRRHEEIARFRQNSAGEVPQGPAWKFVITLPQDPDECFSRIMSVIEAILSTPYVHWPDTVTWRRLLPVWFLDATPVLTETELNVLFSATPEDDWDKLPWEFESWLDAIYVREWLWWSYARMNGKLEIFLSLAGWPAHLEAFEHIITSAGGVIMESHTI